MNQLPDDVSEELKKGNFVVKVGKAKFNQVATDQGKEWLNGTGKKAGGIVGIARSLSALCRWALSFNLCAQMSADTKNIYGLVMDKTVNHKECYGGRIKKDNNVETKLYDIQCKFKVFLPTSVPRQVIENIATKDQATMAITQSLIEVSDSFAAQRLIASDDGSFQQCPPCIKCLNHLIKKEKAIKADRTVLQ